MTRSGITALSFAVLLAVFEIGSCTRCYQCNTQQDPNCGDPFRSTKTVDCNSQESSSYNLGTLNLILPQQILSTVVGAPKYCHKIVMQSGTVVRTCLEANPADANHVCRFLEDSSKLPTTDPTKKIKYCSMCDKDNCNGASSISFSLPLAALALIASYLYTKQ